MRYFPKHFGLIVPRLTRHFTVLCHLMRRYKVEYPFGFFFAEFTNVAETLVSRKLVFYTHPCLCQANCFPLLKATTVNLFKNIT